MTQKIQLRRGTAADLPTGGTIEGEPRFTTDTGLLYIDDGTKNVLIGGTSYETNALAGYGTSTAFTDATVTAALTALGTTDKATLLLSPGTWVFDENIDYSAYTNITFKIPAGAIISHGAYTLKIPNIEAGLYPIFTGTGAITLSGIKAIYPDWWSGDAIDQLQAAFNCALATTPHVPVKLATLFDITGGGAITLNKTADYGDRNRLIIIGEGGGIQKDDSGFVFQGATALVGDILVHDVRFQSTNSAGAILWDCNSIMRINSHHNEYVDWDVIVLQDDIVTAANIAQSLRFTHEQIVGGRGIAFSWVKATDTTISDCLVENRDSFIVNGTYGGADANYNQNHNVRIANNCIQGLVYGDGIAIQLGSTWICTIFNNYLESNKVYIDLKTKQTTSAHRGLTVQNNSIYLSTAQKAAAYKPIIVGDLGELSTAKMDVYLNTFIGNMSDGELYDKQGTGILNSLGDYGYAQTGFDDANIRFLGAGKISRTTAESHVVTYSGIARAYKVSETGISLTSLEKKVVTVTVTDTEIGGPVNLADCISVYTKVTAPANMYDVAVLGVYPTWSSATEGTIDVALENLTEGAVGLALYITVISVVDAV